MVKAKGILIVALAASIFTECQCGKAPTPGDVRELDSLLLAAAGSGDIDRVKELIDEGADIHAKDEDSYSVLFMAICYGHGDLAELLIRRGADISTGHCGGSTPLHCAVYQGLHEVAESLIARGAESTPRTRTAEHRSTGRRCSMMEQRSSS